VPPDCLGTRLWETGFRYVEEALHLFLPVTICGQVKCAPEHPISSLLPTRLIARIDGGALRGLVDDSDDASSLNRAKVKTSPWNPSMMLVLLIVLLSSWLIVRKPRFWALHTRRYAKQHQLRRDPGARFVVAQ